MRDTKFLLLFLVLFEVLGDKPATAQEKEKEKEKPHHTRRPKSTRPARYPTTRYYNPNFGYEPYWPGGDWQYLGRTLYSTTVPPGPQPVTDPPPPPVPLCGDYCSPQFSRFTDVCTMRQLGLKDLDITTWSKDMYGKWHNKILKVGKINYFWTYEGQRNDNPYITMSYCNFLKVSNSRCKFSGPQDVEYIFIHVGKCMTNIRQSYFTPTFNDGTHNPIYTADIFELGPKKRLTKFLQKFYDSKEWTKYYPGKRPKNPFENIR